MSQSQLDLVEKPGKEISIPVTIGKTEPCFLVVDSESSSTDRLQIGLLESFAMQLADEANRAVLVCDEGQPQVVKDAVSYLKKNLDEKVPLDEVADAVGICSFQLCRIFKKQTGMTMTEYVNRLRVERARRRLEDPFCQISDVAEEVGFSSLSQFNRNFLKYSGESPSEYRERLGQLEHCQFTAA